MGIETATFLSAARLLASHILLRQSEAHPNTNTFLPKGIKNKKRIYLFLFWTFSICWSISFIDIFPRNIAATVRYLPCRGSHAAIMFLLSNICWVSSFTVSARYCWLSRLVNGAKPGMKKWRRGNGTMFTASFLRSAFNCQERVNNGVINSCPVHAFATWGRVKGWGWRGEFKPKREGTRQWELRVSHHQWNGHHPINKGSRSLTL